jgi:hypothetical protein
MATRADTTTLFTPETYGASSEEAPYSVEGIEKAITGKMLF